MARTHTYAFVAVSLGLVAVACSTDANGDPSEQSAGTQPTGEPESGEPESSDSAEGWGEELEDESGSEQGCEDCPDGEGRSCISLFQDCGGDLKCVPYWTPADLGGPPTDYKCVKSQGEGLPGASCTLDDLETATDDCEQGSFCWTWGGDEIAGRCQPLCTGGFQYADCIDGWGCVLPDEDPPMCVESCSPLSDACSAGLECVGSTYAYSCIEAGESMASGEPCALLNDCEPASACMDSTELLDCEGESCCTALCSLAGGDGPCQVINPAYVCVPALPEGEDVGICTLPV